MSRTLKYFIAAIFLVAFNFSVVTSRTVVAQDQDSADLTDCINFCKAYFRFIQPHSTLPPSVNVICRDWCLLKQTQTTSTTAPTTTTTTKSTTTTTTATTQPRVRTDIEPSCGQQQILSNRIVGGTQADECEFPWVVRISTVVRISPHINGTQLCGGTIVDKRHVITAAHCLESNDGILSQPYEVQVGVGSSSLQNQTAYGVVKLIRNPKFVNEYSNYDIAVLVLAEDLVYSKCVAPVCLPVASTRVMDGEVCVAAGWGKLGFDDGTRVPYLRKVSLPIVNQDLCHKGNEFLIKIRNWKANDLTLCAGDFRKGLIDSCNGDSGGPLLCLDQDRWVLRGVTSFGYKCAIPNMPGIYTRTSHPEITNFIDESLGLAKLYPMSSSPSELDLVI